MQPASFRQTSTLPPPQTFDAAGYPLMAASQHLPVTPQESPPPVSETDPNTSVFVPTTDHQPLSSDNIKNPLTETVLVPGMTNTAPSSSSLVLASTFMLGAWTLFATQMYEPTKHFSTSQWIFWSAFLCLFAHPILKEIGNLVHLFIHPKPSEPNGKSLTATLDQAVAAYEFHISTPRNLASMGYGLVHGAELLFQGVPLIGSTHFFVGLLFFLSLRSWGRQNKVDDHILDLETRQQTPLTDAGYRFLRQEGLRFSGILPTELPKETLHIPENTDYAKNQKPKKSLVPTLQTAWHLARQSGHFYRRLLRRKGLLPLLKAYLAPWMGTQAPYLSDFQEEATRIYGRLSDAVQRSFKTSLNTPNLLIPETLRGKPLVIIVVPQIGLAGTFFLSQEPDARHVSKEKIHRSWLLKLLGFSGFADTLGIPFVNPEQKELTERQKQGVLELIRHQHALVFSPHLTRNKTTYSNQPNQPSLPSYYAGKPKKGEKETPAQLIQFLGSKMERANPLTVVFWSVTSGQPITPKQGGHLLFQTVRTGESITITPSSEPWEIPADTSLNTIQETIEQRCKELLQIDEVLKAELKGWIEHRNRQNEQVTRNGSHKPFTLMEIFEDKVRTEGSQWYEFVDLIRCIPLQYSERELYIDILLNMLAGENGFQTKIEALRRIVSRLP